MASVITIFDFLAVAFAIWLLRKLGSRRPAGRLPPGPRPLPIVGNLFDMPTEYQWKTFCEWGQRWGGIVSLNMLGQQFVVLNSFQAAVDLLERRSSIYSDRASLISMEMIGYANTFPILTYGDRLKEQRRTASRALGTRAQVEKFGPLKERETHLFLSNLLKDPEHFPKHLKRVTGAIMLLVTYGYQVKRDEKDDILESSFEMIEDFADATLPGAFLVDMITVLRYVPSWFPGAGWKHKIAKFKRTFDASMNDMFAYTKQEMVSGSAIPSFVSRNLELTGSTPEQEDIIKCTGVSLLGGGIDTTLAALKTFFLAMTLYPEAQAKAQAEIDTVVGSDRLPTLQDRNHLPYVNALCLEVLRWLPAIPLGVPHQLQEDDEYHGYFFPKGTVFIVNAWGLLRDPERYRNPSDFMPERFVKSPDHEPEEDPHNIAFGFGRRNCPGMHVADATIFAVVANTLAAFNITKKIENGVPVIPVATQINATISQPIPFECTVKPRSANAETLIRVTNESHDPGVILA